MPETVAILLTLMTSIVVIILVSALCYNIVQRAKHGKKHGPNVQIEQFQTRIAAIETRLADVQDIVISIDDQLKRPTRQPILADHV